MSTLALYVGALSVAIGAVLSYRVVQTFHADCDVSERRLSDREWLLLFGAMVLLLAGVLAVVAQAVL